MDCIHSDRRQLTIAVAMVPMMKGRSPVVVVSMNAPASIITAQMNTGVLRRVLANPGIAEHSNPMA